MGCYKPKDSTIEKYIEINDFLFKTVTYCLLCLQSKGKVYFTVRFF